MVMFGCDGFGLNIVRNPIGAKAALLRANILLKQALAVMMIMFGC